MHRESCRTHVSGGTHWIPRDLGSDPCGASLLPTPQRVWPLGGDSSSYEYGRKQTEQAENLTPKFITILSIRGVKTSYIICTESYRRKHDSAVLSRSISGGYAECTIQLFKITAYQLRGWVLKFLFNALPFCLLLYNNARLTILWQLHLG